MKKHLGFLFSLLLLTVSCQEKESERVITKIETEQSHYTITDGEYLTINVIHTPADLPAPEYDLTVADPEILSDRTISELMIRGRKPGTSDVFIVAKGQPSLSAQCKVTVLPLEIDGVSLDRTSVELTEGDEITLTATVSPENATNKNVVWSSSNPSVAAVSDGKVTAVSAGTATITVTTEDGGKTATCEVKVNAKVYPVTSVSLDRVSVELTEGDEVTLTATVSPDNATNKNVVWSSSNPSVATVSDGKVTAVSAGTATITVTTEDGDKTATCEVKVRRHTESVGENAGIWK